MAHKHEIQAGDAVRLLSNAMYHVHELELTGEGSSPLCKSQGELMLHDALFYLSYGDTDNARIVMELYDTWVNTGIAPWPYSGGPPQQR